MTPDNQSLLEYITAWLEEPRRESDGGWAPVGEGEVEALESIIWGFIRARWGPDPDGDLPIEFIVVNRTTHQRLPFRPVRYASHVRQQRYEELERSVDAAHCREAIANLRSALEAMPGYILDELLRGLEFPPKETP